MVEYSGYIPQQNVIDWSSITNKIAKDIQSTMDEREAQREKLDAEARNAISKINEYQSAKAPTFNQFIMDGANSARDYIYEQNKILKSGLITPSQYSRNVSSLSDGWKRLADNAKSFDADYMEQIKRIESGQASAQEIFQSQIKSKIADLKDKRILISPENGGVFISSNDGEIWDVQTMNAGLNQKADKVDLYGEVNKYIKMLGTGAKIDPATGKYAVSETLISDFKKKTKPRIIESILSNPQKAASVLADHSDMGYTFVDDPKKQGGKNILISRDENGIWTPRLTKEQENQAEKLVGDVIDSQVSYQQAKPEALSFSERLALENARSQNRREEKALGSASVDINDRYRKVMDIAAHPGNSEYKDLIKGVEFDPVQFKGYTITQMDRPLVNGKPGDFYNIYISAPEVDDAGQIVSINGLPKMKELVRKINSKDIYSYINSWMNQKSSKKLDVDWEQIKDNASYSRPNSVNLNATAIKKGK